MRGSQSSNFEEDCKVEDPSINMAIEEIRYDSKKLKEAFMDQMGSRLSEIMDHVVDSFEKSSPPELSRRTSLLSKGYTLDHRDKKKPKILGKLPEKEFQCRPSVLTQLLELPHFRTIHHIFIASLILMLLHTMLVDLTETGMVDLGLERLMGVLGEPQRAWSLIFSLHFASIFILYPSFYYWSTSRRHYTKETQQIFDRVAATLFGIFLILFICLPARILWKTPLPWASSMIATMEQGRLLMKMYAFVRSNVPKALNFNQVKIEQVNELKLSNGTIHKQAQEKLESTQQKDENSFENESEFEIMGDDEKNVQLNCENKNNNVIKRKTGEVAKSIDDRSKNEEISKRPTNIRQFSRKESWISWDDENFPCPDFTKYLYFLFAPTLIYRDFYPRTKTIRWHYVCWNLAQCIGCALYANFVMGRFCTSHLQNFGVAGQAMNLKELLALIFSFMLPGTVMLILTFFLILHAWQNAFAEMLYFGDRLFYKDWWNSASYSVYYKTWNCLVHDWLYTYIFKDAWEGGLGKLFKPLPTILVFLVSALFHEYILCMSFNFFFPVNLILFGGFGFIFVFIGSKKQSSSIGNVLIWMSLIAGTGIIVAAYSMEAYARMNCTTPLENYSAFRDFFVPRTISCGAIRFEWN